MSSDDLRGKGDVCRARVFFNSLSTFCAENWNNVFALGKFLAHSFGSPVVSSPRRACNPVPAQLSVGRRCGSVARSSCSWQSCA